MTANDLKIEIQKVLDKVPDNLLQDVFSCLEEVQKRTASDFNNTQHLKKILTEDKELLKKLAQ